METVSIIVPMYNVERFLHRCFGSIFAQTYPLLEIIAISDASPDNSFLVAKQIADNANVIGGGKTLIAKELKENIGAGAVRDIGVQMATGKYLMFVDPDDWIHPQLVQICVEALEKDNCQMAQADFQITSKSDIDFRKIDNPLVKIIKGNIQIETFTEHISCSKLYITDIVRQNNLKMIHRIFEDTAFTRAYSLLCDKAAFISEPMYYYFVNPDSAIHTLTIDKVVKAIERTNDVIAIYLQYGLAQKAKTFSEGSQKRLIRTLLLMPNKSHLNVPEDMHINLDTNKIIQCFNNHRALFNIYAYMKLGLKFSLKQLLKFLNLK